MSARTDPGIQVNLELAEFKNQTADLRCYSLLGAILLDGFVMHAKGAGCYWVGIFFVTLFIILAGAVFVFDHNAANETEKFDGYRGKVFEI